MSTDPGATLSVHAVYKNAQQNNKIIIIGVDFALKNLTCAAGCDSLPPNEGVQERAGDQKIYCDEMSTATKYVVSGVLS